MVDAASRGEVDGGRQRRHELHHIVDRHCTALAEDDVERVAHGVLLREERGAVVEPSRNRRCNVRVIDPGCDDRVQLDDERGSLFGGEVETKNLYRNEPLATAIARLVCAKHRTQRARTNLMENSEGPECFRRKVQDRVFAVQRPNGNINSLHIPVDIRRFPSVKKLAADYAFNYPALAPFFAGDPESPASWTAAIESAQRHPRRRGDLSALLTKQLERRNAPAAARAAAARLADPSTVAIVTGQQAGLFGGPLYTLYKALTAIKLAEKVTADYSVPAVAVFWVEGEDHDWDEVASVSVLDQEMQRRVLTLPAPASAGHASICTIVLDGTTGTAIEQLASALPPTEFTGEVIDLVRQAYAPGVSMSDAFARLLERLLGDLGLIVFECSDRAAKPLAADIFSREITNPGRTWELAAETGRQLIAGGYHAQVESPSTASTALFRVDGSRTAIDIGEAAALAGAAREHPDSFSPNVLLRPIVQDAIFPTAAYVSGPNELAYLAQLRSAYEQFGVPMPLMFPRATATILDSAGARFLEKHELPFEALQARDESALNRLLAASLPAEVESALKRGEDAIQETMAAIIASVPQVDATLEGAAKSTLGKLQHDITSLRGKVISAAKKRDETLRRQFARAQSQAFPDGVPQERLLGIVAMLNRYGPALVQRLMQELPLDTRHHTVLTL